MSQQDENLLPAWDNLPLQERLRKRTERYEEEKKQPVFGAEGMRGCIAVYRSAMFLCDEDNK